MRAKRVFWFVWVVLTIFLILFVVTGEYRKLTVLCYLALEEYYTGDIKLSKVVMFAESCFLAAFALYMILLFVLLARFFKKKLSFFGTSR